MRRTTLLKLTTAIGIGLGGLTLSAGAAAAQDASAKTPATGASGAQSEPYGLSEIVVTAQKREENLQRAAVAVTAVGADVLQRAAVTNATQLTNVAPALQINNTFGPTNNFYLRGVGNFVTNVSSDPAVIVNLDGVPLGRPTGVQGLFFDLQRVEVLKGPQGTLYGRNATGGAINVITAQPKFGEYSGFANLSYGNYNAVGLDGAVNLPIGDKAAIRVAGMFSKRDGTYSDGAGDEDLKAVRVAVASRLTDDLKVTVGLDYSHMGGKGPGSTVFGLDRDQRIGLNDPRAGALYSSPEGFSFLAGTTLYPLHTPIFEDNDFWGVRLQADLDTSLGTVSLIPAYRQSKLNLLTNAVGLEARTFEKDQQSSVELRLVSPSANRLQYILGAFYFNENDDSADDYNYQVASFFTTIKPKTDSYAAYGRLTYAVTPSLRVSVGARYTEDQRSTNNLLLNTLVICPGSTLNPPGPFCFGARRLPVQLGVPAQFLDASGNVIPFIPGNGGAPLSTFIVNSVIPNVLSKTFTRATWRGAIEYDVAPRSLLYATVETGYKSGGFFSTPDPVHNFYRPETITAFTVGSKNRFFDNRLQLNAELFWWDYKNQQVSHFISYQNTVVFATDNVGASRMRGVEIEARAQVLEHTELNATVQYLDAQNRNFAYTSSIGAGPPISACPVSIEAVAPPATPTNYIVDCSGKRPANAPAWTINAGLQQRFPLGDLGDLTLNVGTRFQSSSYTGTELLPSQIQKSFFVTDLQLQYETSDGRYTVAGFANNVGNSNAVGFSQAFPRAPGLLIENLRMPRTYGIRAGAKF